MLTFLHTVIVKIGWKSEPSELWLSNSLIRMWLSFLVCYINHHSFELLLGSSRPELFCKKVLLIGNFVNNKTPAHLFSYEFSEIFRGNFFARHICEQPFLNILCIIFLEKKALNCKLKGNMCTCLNWSFKSLSM